MRFLGLDLGARSVGVALSDETLLIASSYKTIFYDGDYKKVFEELESIIQNFKIKKIILGYPKNMNNSVGFRAKETLEFKKQLEENFNLEVILMDERLTTKEATSYMLEADISRKKRKKKIDSLAATIILQTYLDREDKNE